MRRLIHKGWMRVWIVSSTLIFLASFITIYPTHENQRTWQISGYREADIKTHDDEIAVINNFFNRPQRYLSKEMRNCSPNEAYLTPLHQNQANPAMTVSCPRSALGKLQKPLTISIILSALLLFLGLVVSWIRSGFKQAISEG